MSFNQPLSIDECLVTSLVEISVSAAWRHGALIRGWALVNWLPQQPARPAGPGAPGSHASAGEEVAALSHKRSGGWRLSPDWLRAAWLHPSSSDSIMWWDLWIGIVCLSELYCGGGGVLIRITDITVSCYLHRIEHVCTPVKLRRLSDLQR